MRTAAVAIAWEFRQRHRAGLVALPAAIVTLGAIKLVLLADDAHLETSDATFALFAPVPLAAAFLYLLAVFTFGISGDLAARESMYPRRMFTLPVSSAALAGWPMLYGCAAMSLLWFAMRLACTFPPGVDIPKYWPALFAASLLSWTQALTWMPYPLRGMRIAISIALLVSIDVVVFTAIENKTAEGTMLLLLAPCVPLAYATALVAVRRARRGDVPEWHRRPASARVMPGAVTRREFASAARAQLWFEWRQYGWSLPLLVAAVLPVAVAMFFLFRDTGTVVVEVVAGALLLPPFLAVFVGATAGKSSANEGSSYGISPFVATRPVEDRALVVAKWHAALLSTLAAWTIVLAVLWAGLAWSGAAAPVIEIASNADSALGHPRAIALGLLVLLGLAGATWKQLVQGFYISMTGRDSAVKGVAFATLALLTAGCFVLGWILSSRTRMAIVWEAIPWVMSALAAIRLVLAAYVMQRGIERGLFTDRQCAAAAVAWDVCVLAVYGALASIIPAIVTRRYLLLLAAMLVVPFVRLAATPLAVAGNRHR